jgi:hypothetical protein
MRRPTSGEQIDPDTMMIMIMMKMMMMMMIPGDQIDFDTNSQVLYVNVQLTLSWDACDEILPPGG